MNQEESEHNEVDGMMKGADSTGEVMYRIRLSVTIRYCAKTAKLITEILSPPETSPTS